MKVSYASHCSYRIRYHMVFVVKYRKQMLLNSVPDAFLKDVLSGISMRYYFDFDAVGIEHDHFHIIVGAAPRHAPSDIMRTIKSIMAREIFSEFPDVKETLWGGEFWSDGGHIDTISTSILGYDQIRKYVEEQGNDIKQLTLLDF